MSNESHLELETTIFFAGALALYMMGQARWGIAMAIILVLLYLAEYDRVLWLIR